MNGDAGMLGTPAGTLPDPPAEAAQREVQAGQIPTTLASLGGGLLGDRLARHVPGRAVPQALVVNEVAGLARRPIAAA